jgi:hypothetical protein
VEGNGLERQHQAAIEHTGKTQIPDQNTVDKKGRSLDDGNAYQQGCG